MRKRVALFLTGLFICMSPTFAQDMPAEVVVAFRKGNSQELDRHLGDRVDLIIQNKSAHVDKLTAEVILSAFFSDNKVSGFYVNHQDRRDESGFIIGTLTTSNGTFRVNCFFRRVQDKYVIHQIRIDQTNE